MHYYCKTLDFRHSEQYEAHLLKLASLQKRDRGHLCAHFGASVASRSSEYFEAQCCEEKRISIVTRQNNTVWQTSCRDHELGFCVKQNWILIVSYLLREPVRWPPRFCKWFDGATDRYPGEVKTCCKVNWDYRHIYTTAYYFFPSLLPLPRL